MMILTKERFDSLASKLQGTDYNDILVYANDHVVVRFWTEGEPATQKISLGYNYKSKVWEKI